MIRSCRPMAFRNSFIRHSTVPTGSSCPRRRSISHLYMPRVRQGVTSQASTSSPRTVQKLVLARMASNSFSSRSCVIRPSRLAATITACRRVIRSFPV